MSPLSRNPRDATIQFRDIQRWGRCRGLLRGRSHGRHVHRPSLDGWLALTGISFGSVLLCPPVRGPCGPLRGYGLVRSRRPDTLAVVRGAVVPVVVVWSGVDVRTNSCELSGEPSSPWLWSGPESMP